MRGNRRTGPKRPRTRAEELHQRIADEIIRGRLLPGTRLEEKALADRFNASRTPVREALQRLASSGLVDIRPHRGVFVAGMTPEGLAEMFEAMAELEASCARLAAERMTVPERRALEDLARRGDAISTSEDIGGYQAFNLDFHAAIYRGAHNGVLEDLALRLRGRVQPFRSAQFDIPGRLLKSQHEHARVVKAIIDGDPEGAYRGMREHLLTVSAASATFANADLATG